jgi:hypothetical protein
MQLGFKKGITALLLALTALPVSQIAAKNAEAS